MRYFFPTLLIVFFFAARCPAGEEQIPAIEYGKSRESTGWVDTSEGRVAVDKGIEWQGVKAYLSLTCDLVVVEAKSNKTLWSKSVGAFWNRMSFAEIGAKAGKKVWAVELKPASEVTDGKDAKAYYEITTGNELKQKNGSDVPSGQSFRPRKIEMGSASCLSKPFTVIVSTLENWKLLQKKMFDDKEKLSGAVSKQQWAPQSFDSVDFSKEVILVTSAGSSWNCWGLGVQEAFEDEHRIMVRLARATFQTLGPDGGAIAVRPFGIFVLPKSESKAYVLEQNTQGYIGGPALWKEVVTLPKLPEAKAELDKVPAE